MDGKRPTRARAPWPRLWLMTDERIGDLLSVVSALPRGSGIIFRHYATPARDRRALFEAVRRVARARGHVLLLAGSARKARAWRADGAHGRGVGCVSAPVHDQPERIAAERRGARLLLISPVFATRSHPGATPLGRMRFGLLARGARGQVIALGGMTAQRAKSLRQLGADGWAAIDGLSGQRAHRGDRGAATA